MEKIVFKFIKRLNNPFFILWMIGGILSLAFVPLFRSVVAKEILIIWSLAVLIPLTIYFTSVILFFIVASFSVFPRISQLSKVTAREISVKELSRQLSVSPRIAYFILEMAERSGEYDYQGKLIYVAKEKN